MSTSQLASAVNCSQYCNAISSDWEHKTGYRESNDPLHDVSATYNVDVADWFYQTSNTQEDDGLKQSFSSKKEQMSKYGQRRLGINGEVPNTINFDVTGPK